MLCMASPAGITRATVITTAAKLAEKRGFRNVTLAMVAAELGIRSQSLYAHVDGIDGLRHALAVRGQEQLADTLRTAVMARSGRDALHAWARAFSQFAAKNPGLYEASVRAPKRDAELVASSRRAMEPLLALLASYGIEGDDALHEYRAIWSSLHGFVSLRSAGLFTLSADPNETLEHLIDMIANHVDR
jgi:AcrR family transcriptional regulator